MLTYNVLFKWSSYPKYSTESTPTCMLLTKSILHYLQNVSQFPRQSAYSKGPLPDASFAVKIRDAYRVSLSWFSLTH